ncbi:MAG: type II toxin-antitoxin system RelE/ParE family toxin [Pirellulales bacterium]
MRVAQHPDANAELIEAARYYESSVPTFGKQFLDAIDDAIALISRSPERCAVVEHDIRRYILRRFPFSIYFRVEYDLIRILAFKHHSRHPDYWRDRLS